MLLVAQSPFRCSKEFLLQKQFSALALIILLTIKHLFGQVVNDNIENSILLEANIPISSSTSDCTLQWSCLNHKLTKKCIQYHNDQWFHFKVANDERSYINISKQDCRDLRGVQLLVIDGQPCQPETYKIIECTSLGNHDDIFISLDGLEQDKEYLLQIDGYLHDFCSFQIEYSNNPKGLPLGDQGMTPMKINAVTDLHIEISWDVPVTIARYIKKYEIYRRYDSSYKSEKIRDVTQDKNAFGSQRLDYLIDDILPDYGTFHYKIIGANDSDRILISSTMLDVPRPQALDEKVRKWVEIELTYTQDVKLKILIYDNVNYSLLYWCGFNYTSNNQIFKYNVENYLDQGIKDYRIEVERQDTNEKKTYIITK